MSSEREDTVRLANHILDRVNADPDDDLAMLSRQFLRSLEREALYRDLLKPFADAASRAKDVQSNTQRLGQGVLSDEASTGLGIKFKHLFAVEEFLRATERIP